MPRLSKIGAACLAAFGYSGGSATTANYLVVAGGGGGGGYVSGGGGAGGLLLGITNLNPTQSYVVTVGAGGTNIFSPQSIGGNGGNSVFGAFATAIGGGGGAVGGGAVGSATVGGSGGGGASTTASLTGAAGTSGQGNAGGNSPGQAANYPSGGGGGAGGVGGSPANTSSLGGVGGVGTSSAITGTSTFYAGGGGGAATTGSLGAGGAGGNGGGGSGGSFNAGGAYLGGSTSGAANTGGGGGGGRGVGGSGVVIISYASPTQIFGGGIVTFVGGNWIHTFRTSGTLVPVSTFTASYLVISGGGGGSSGGNYGGGGGAGSFTTGSNLVFDENSNYTVVVGAGGTSNLIGSQSSLTLVSTTVNAGNPGSGVTGGASGNGNAGGTGQNSGGWGGGGGAGTSGNGGTASGAGGAGGAGTANSISGSSVTRGGGGGGAATTGGGAGGAGGGGAGGSVNAGTGTAGTANTGSGGGGAVNGTGGAGGSGIVIISYAGAQRMAGGTVTFVGGNTIHTFTSSGYLSALKLVNNSLRFKASTSSSLTRTPTVAGSFTTWTWSGWVKRGKLGARQFIFSSGVSPTASQVWQCEFNANDKLEFYNQTIGTYRLSTQVFRDPSAWYHIVFCADTNNGTAQNRFRCYINGVEITAWDTNSVIASGYSFALNGAYRHAIGEYSYTLASGISFDGYMTEINFVDGQALTPSSFGGYNSFGVWQPTEYLGSYGTNGFDLPFTNNASSTTIGFDFSPNQNNWTANGFTLTPTTSVLYDSMTDVPTLTSATASNWCVANPLDAATGLTINDGNLKLAASAVGSKFVRSSIALPATGAFYAEITFANASTSNIGETIGICTAARSLTAAYNAASAYLFYASNFGFLVSNGTTLTSSLTAIAANELFQVAIDVTNSKMWIGRTNVWYNSTGGTTGNPSTGANPTFTGAFVDYFIYAGFDTNSAVTANINFGQRPFVGTVPTGFVALNTFNM